MVKTSYTPKVQAKEAKASIAGTRVSQLATNGKQAAGIQISKSAEGQNQFANSDQTFQAMERLRQMQKGDDDNYSRIAQQANSNAFNMGAQADSIKTGNQFLLNNQQLSGQSELLEQQLKANSAAQAYDLNDAARRDNLNAYMQQQQLNSQDSQQRQSLEAQKEIEKARIAGGLFSSMFGSISGMNNMAVNYWR